MADKTPTVATHRAYSVIRRDGQDDCWVNIGLVFQHKDGDGFNPILQAFPLDGNSYPSGSLTTRPETRRNHHHAGGRMAVLRGMGNGGNEH